MTFDGDISRDATVSVLRYRNPKTGATAYAVWSPTADGTKIADYLLPIGIRRAKSVKVVEMRHGAHYGLSTYEPVVNGKVIINVGETPIFVIVER
jgi:hypothetical protein